MADRRAVVVGGGRVALRRARGLLDAGANVIVVAPSVLPELAALPVTVLRRRYRPGDLAAAWLAHAATDDPAVNARVAADADAARIWCIRADAATASRAWTPTVTRHGAVTIAVTSGDPARSRRLRAAIALALADGSLPVRAERARHGAGSVALIGAGPGDPGLITVLGRRLLAEADVVVTDKLAP
ncbi:MAG TPA: NAD(P)-dependent oxidoreductase, partial [Streptosporangiaceae bacterium]|nr:NAD(P)-dependent oxidoreductase [Streptosporangiaceae bacterium]